MTAHKFIRSDESIRINSMYFSFIIVSHELNFLIIVQFHGFMLLCCFNFIDIFDIYISDRIIKLIITARLYF